MEKNTQRTYSLSLNTNFLKSDAVRRLVDAGKGDALVTFLALQTLVRAAGYCVMVDENLIDGICASIGRSGDSIRADIAAIVDAGFFDAGMFATRGVLTTRRLQAAYRRRKDAQPIPEEFQLKARRSVSSRRRSAKAVAEPEPPVEPVFEVPVEPAVAETAAPELAVADVIEAEKTAAGTAVAEAVGDVRRMSRSARRRARRRAARAKKGAAGGNSFQDHIM